MASKKSKQLKESTDAVFKTLGDEPKQGKRKTEKKAKVVEKIDESFSASITLENKPVPANKRKLRPDELIEEVQNLKAEVELLKLVLNQVLSFLKK